MIKKAILYLSITTIVLSGLYFIFTTSSDVRYWVDDFCSATFLRMNGFWGAQIMWWKSWTGRYSYIFFLDIFESIGPLAANALPILLFLSLVAGMRLICCKSYYFAFLFVMLVLINTPNIIQSFYWQTGSLNYTIPFVFFNFSLALLLSRNRKHLDLLVFVLMFMAGGFSESFALAALVIWFIVTMGVLIINPKNKSQYLRISVAGLVGVVASLTFMSFAPGNAARGASVTKPESMSFVIGSTIWATKWYLLKLLSTKTLLSSLAVLFTSIFFFSKKITLPIKKAIYLCMLPVFAIVLVLMAVMGSGYYSMSTVPPERTLFIITYVVLLCFAFFSIIATSLIKGYTKGVWPKRIAVLMILFNVVFSGLVTASMWRKWTNVRNEVATYAVSWDKEVKNLPNIHNIKSVGGLDDFVGNKGWVQGCISGYYGLNSVKMIE